MNKNLKNGGNIIMNEIVYKNERGNLFPTNKSDFLLQRCCTKYNNQLDDCILFVTRKLPDVSGIFDSGNNSLYSAGTAEDTRKLNNCIKFIRNAKHNVVFRKNLLGGYMPSNNIYNRYFKEWSVNYIQQLNKKRMRKGEIDV